MGHKGGQYAPTLAGRRANGGSMGSQWDIDFALCRRVCHSMPTQYTRRIGGRFFTAYRARFYFTLPLAPALTAYARRENLGKLVVSPVSFYF